MARFAATSPATPPPTMTRGACVVVIPRSRSTGPKGYKALLGCRRQHGGHRHDIRSIAAAILLEVSAHRCANSLDGFRRLRSKDCGRPHAAAGKRVEDCIRRDEPPNERQRLHFHVNESCRVQGRFEFTGRAESKEGRPFWKRHI